ncbi:hypothetical protein H9L21_11200 [Aeromicrobium senzhongii]|uniref:Uncharacterized protein n=1 Tax=Aeromicrobium senzhongii TaxID=2663859 RepID=A0ABX6SSV6_9ACTN|nr:hypothetical protein [Aeromicrobium senzhongii]MTB89057.1 hypothetical protein [Aeromicrobium senzhongii]QNL93672.1 hypothetical protein H9L21_11200 [Aeromicrobium senzhongii]
MSDASELYRRGIHAVEERLSTAPDPRALAVFDAYVDDAVSTDRGCAFLNAAGELPSDHPAQDMVRAHKRAVRRLLADRWRARSRTGASTTGTRSWRARELAERLLGPR